MDKYKIEKAAKRIENLLFLRGYLSDENIDYVDIQIVDAARKILAAAGDDIAEKSTPAGQYVSDIIFTADGSAIVYYNGDTAGKRFDISAKYALYPTD